MRPTAKLVWDEADIPNSSRELISPCSHRASVQSSFPSLIGGTGLACASCVTTLISRSGRAGSSIERSISQPVGDLQKGHFDKVS